MRLASRFMPKFARRRWPGFVLLGILALIPVYFFLGHPLGTSLVIAGLLGFGVFEHRRYKLRIRKLAESRAGESICEFARSFERRQIDTWVIRAVCEEIQEYLGGSPPVPIRAADRLKDDLPIDAEDLEMDLAGRISQRTGRSFNTSANPYYAKINTVEDLVLFFNGQGTLSLPAPLRVSALFISPRCGLRKGITSASRSKGSGTSRTS